MSEDLLKYSVRDTKNTIRISIKKPDEFVQDSFKIIPIGRDTGIRVVAGKLKSGSGTMQVQAYIFDKSRCTRVKAEAWVKGHANKFQIISFNK
jgi:hypothetical protein